MSGNDLPPELGPSPGAPTGSPAPPAPLRPLGVVRATAEGRGLVRLLDPLGLAGPDEAGGRPRPELVLEERAYALARFFDGRRTPAEIAAEWRASSGQPLAAAEVEALAAGLSARCALDDARFAARRDAEWRAFASSPERPFVGAGSDYEGSPFDLRVRIAGLVADDWDMPPTPGVFGLVAPACDLARGARLYARSYAALRHAGSEYARVLLIGQLRAPLVAPIVALDRAFATPLGTVPCDLEGVRALGLERTTEELAHRGALVLERQCLFLRLLFPRLAIVPVLAAELDPRSRAGAAAVERAALGLARVLALPGRTLVLVASDLSERGGPPPGPDAARALREEDRECIERLAAADAEGLVARAGRRRQGAGSLFALWLLARLAGGRRSLDPDRGPLEGSVLGYQQMQGPGTFASAASVLFH